jgi:uncharacterized protein YkwD
MRRRSTMLAVLALLVTGLAAPAPAAAAKRACDAVNQIPTSSTLTVARHAVFCLINRRRTESGVRPLSPSFSLQTAAQGHTDVMDTQKFFDHAGSDGDPLTRAVNAGYTNGARSWNIGEDLRWGYGSLSTPRSAVNAWMNSAVHRAVLLDPAFTQLGIGVEASAPVWPTPPSAATYTALFGSRQG